VPESRESSGLPVILLPDAGPLITLAYAGALDLLLKPGWPLRIVDMVLDEVTRNATPTSKDIGRWVAQEKIAILPTRTYGKYQEQKSNDPGDVRKTNLGELAIQEVMHDLALDEPETVGVFLFEDHKIARASFLVPGNCRKISTRAWLQFLESRGLIPSAVEVERSAINNGRHFSQLRFPP
jgi:hypothetical protein